MEKKDNGPLLSKILFTVVLDIFLIGVILLTFAFFHHVLPALQSKWDQAAVESTPPEQTVQTTVPPETTAPSTTQSEPDATETLPEETTVPTEPLEKTEWQLKFAEHFTDKVVVTENSYTSPYVSINIETVQYGSGWTAITYYVADIYVASLDNFTTYTAHNEMRYFSKQDVLEMDAASDAVIAISGDFYSYQKTGFLMRNGFLYKSDRTYCDILVLFEDGVMATYPRDGYDIQEILDQGACQVWNFGPALLDENGNVKSSYKTTNNVGADNPRSAVGYYEPGHYLFVVVDGREKGHSVGMSIPDLANIFVERGCKVAYNLDGGGSAVMTFQDALYSRPSEDRALSDILLVKDGPPKKEE